MASKPDIPAINVDEERLEQALISRGRLTREEIQQCRQKSGSGGGAEALLARLVDNGFLTANQAQRATQELKLLMGQQIPGFHLMEKLGQGAMGTVYKARQLSMNRLVAIKILQPRLAANPGFLKHL